MFDRETVIMLDDKINKVKDLEKDFHFSDKGFLFDGTTGLTYSLNSTGGFIFDKLRKGNKVSEILTMLVDEFMVNDETAGRDLKDFIQFLDEYRIIEIK